MTAKAMKRATDREIRDILGPGGDDLVSAIRKIGASPAEVLQAAEWLDDDDHMGKTARMTANVRRVYEILQEDREKSDRE